MPLKGKPNSKQLLLRKLANLNADIDAVAIFKPNGGLSFYIPDTFVEMIKEDEGNLPSYVWAVLLHVHLYKYFESDPTIIEFKNKMQEQILLDLRTEDDVYQI